MEKLNKRTLEKENDFSEKKEEFNVKDDKKKGKKWKHKKGKGKGYKGKQSNDPAWHGKNSQLLKDLCTIPFNTMLGFSPSLSSTRKLCLPSMRSYYVDWYPGESSDFRSFLNTAATNIWEFIRSRNSGATNYQSSDIFINVILGCLDMVSTTNYLARFFKMTKVYSIFNRMIPKYLFELCHVDYEDFISNIANYRGRYNILLAKASAVVIPKQFPIYDWVCSMFSDIYKDRDSETGREQLLISVKKQFKIFKANESPQGGIVRGMNVKDLIPTSANLFSIGFGFGSRKVKFATLLDIWETQINAIITDEDTNIIFGDLIKAYGSESSFWKATPVSEDENIEPIYSEEFLLQYHNAILLPSPAVSSSIESETLNGDRIPTLKNYNWKVSQDTLGYLRTEYGYAYGTDEVPAHLSSLGVIRAINEDKTILDCNYQDPSPEQVMTMTRYHNRYTYTSSSRTVKIESASAVILFEGEQIYINGANVISSEEVAQYYSSMYIEGTPGSILKFARHTNFDWNKLLYIIDETNPDMLSILGDINNIKPIEKDTIAAIHQVDFASLYDIPFSSKF